MASLPRAGIICLGLAISAVAVLQPAFAQKIDLNDPEAMRKLAATVPKLDILGVTLGMSPQEVTAALKAAAPNLKIDTIYTRMDKPGTTTFERVPHWMIASTPPVADASGETIGVEFTTPPARAVAAKIVREVRFKPAEPVLASTLADALMKKYGPGGMSPGNGSLVWLFNDAGKVVTQPPPDNVVRGCTGTFDEGFPMLEGGVSYEPARDYGTINTSTVVVSNDYGDRQAACAAFSVVQGHNLGKDSGPGTQMMRRLQVSVQSGKLLYNASKATHDWLQQQADALKNKNQDDASKRAAPKL